MELLIKNVNPKDRKDFEEFLNNYSDKLRGEYKDEMEKSRMFRAAKWAGKRAGIDASVFLEMQTDWNLEKKVYHLTIISPVESLPNFKQMLRGKLEKELQRIDKKVKVELNG